MFDICKSLVSEQESVLLWTLVSFAFHIMDIKAIRLLESPKINQKPGKDFMDHEYINRRTENVNLYHMPVSKK